MAAPPASSFLFGINLRMDNSNSGFNNEFLYLVNFSWIFNKMMMFMAFINRVRIHSFAEDTDEVSEKPFVHIFGHLVEYQPVAKRAVLDIVTNMAIILVLLEVSPDFPFDQLVSVTKLGKI